MTSERDLGPAKTLDFFFLRSVYFEREVGRGRQRGKEAYSPLSTEPDAGLHPRTLRS